VIVGSGDYGLVIGRGREIKHAPDVPALCGLARRTSSVPQTNHAVDTRAVCLLLFLKGF
jgi:hypothetical protein